MFFFHLKISNVVNRMFLLCITKELKSKLTDLLHFDFVDILFNL